MDKVKITALFMALLICSAANIACGSETASNPYTTDVENITQPEENTEITTAVTADIPEKDYEEYEFKIIGVAADKYSYLGDEIWRESENGESLNDAVFKRNIMTEEKLNVTIVKVNSSNVQSDLKKSVIAADDAYDAVVGTVSEYSPSITSGYLLELDKMSYLDTSKPWWMSEVINDFSIAGKRFLLFGDIIWQDKESIWALCFNKDLAEENNLDDPYQLVLNGNWTLDMLSSQCMNISMDINGDTVMDYNDQWGLLGSRTAGLGLITSCGAFVSQSDNNGLNFILDSARNISAMDKIYDFIHSDNLMLRAEDLKGVDDIWTGIINIFREGRALYRISIMKDIAGLRDMDNDFGILPMPKCDDTQEQYYTTYQGHSAKSVSVPTTVSDTERTGIVIEYMGYVSSDTMLKAYYDTTLQRKVSRDEESAKMLDIIFKSVITDPALSLELGSIRDKLVSMINADTNTNISSIASIKESIQKKLNEIYETVSEFD